MQRKKVLAPLWINLNHNLQLNKIIKRYAGTSTDTTIKENPKPFMDLALLRIISSASLHTTKDKKVLTLEKYEFLRDNNVLKDIIIGNKATIEDTAGNYFTIDNIRSEQPFYITPVLSPVIAIIAPN